jgi:hypothetical protein
MNEAINPVQLAAATATALRNADGTIVVADPFTPGTYHSDPDAIIKSMFARRDERRKDFDALGDVATADIGDVKLVYKSLEEDDDALLDFEKKLNAALLDLSGFKAVVVQMKGAKARIDPMSVRGKFAEMAKALKARVDAEKPAEPVHTYCIKLTCTDKTLAAVMKAAQKAGASDLFAAAAQSDKAVKDINKWFEANA